MNKILPLVLIAFVLSGCGLFGKKNKSTPAAGGATEQGEAGSTTGYGAGEGLPPPVVIGESGQRMGGGSGAGAGAGNIVYFEFDSIEITESGRAIVAATGQHLAANPAAKVRLEGHADERGTREYNVGLGERRASAVMQALVAAGASSAQISVISYGEERPAVPGPDESAWAMNRRVEIVR